MRDRHHPQRVPERMVQVRLHLQVFVTEASQTVHQTEPFERELSEMFGVTVVGIPNPERLYLPDDWPEGVYPLRKDFERRALNEECGHAYDATG